MSNECLISICIPAYEKAAQLERLLNSIAVQKFRAFEVIVTDDSKSDAVEKTVAAFSNQFPLRYYRSAAPSGMGNNWNNCTGMATAPWIKMMHDDDWFVNETSLQQFAEKARAGKSDFIISGSSYIGVSTGKADTVLFTMQDKKLTAQLPMSLLFLNTIGHPSVTLYRKDTAILFDPQFRWVIDVDFYIRYLLKHPGSFEYIDEALVNITKDDQQVSAASYKNAFVEIPEYLNLLLKFEPAIHLTNKYAFYSVWELVRKFSIKHTAQLKNYGYKGPIPEKITAIISIQNKIPGFILKQPPVNRKLMDWAFNRLKVHGL